MYSIDCAADGLHFEVSYFDVSPYEANHFDHVGAISGAASAFNGRVMRRDSRSIAGHQGWRAEIALADERFATLVLFVADRRVYVLACANHGDKPSRARDYFFENFRLITEEHGDALASSSLDELRVVMHDDGADRDRPTASKVVLTVLENDRGSKVGAPWNVKLKAHAGTGPYTWSVDSLPRGVHSIVVGDELRLSGSPRQAGYFSVAVSVRDKNHSLATAQFPMMVHE